MNCSPGLPDPKNPTYANYSEKFLVGYRFYDYHNISFTTGRPFGYGLSYTAFKISPSSQRGRTVKVRLENEGNVSGSEVVQGSNSTETIISLESNLEFR